MKEYIVKADHLIDGYGMQAVGELIRCKDCKWWDRFDDSPIGYCHACKHGYYSDKWEISIRRTYKEDFYCADGERETDDD